VLTKDWLIDAVLYVYALSLLFFASDAASGNRSVRRTGAGLLVFVWVLQTAFLLSIVFRQLEATEISTKEFLFFVSWLLVTISFLLNRFMRAELLVFFVNVVGFAVLALNLLQRGRHGTAVSSGETVNRLLVLHISFMVLAFVALTLAAVMCGMYVFLHNRLKSKRWSASMNRLPSLELIDRYAFRAWAIGAPLLFLSLSTGTAALLMERDAQLLLDAKGLFSFAAGAVYIIYMLRRSASSDDGKRLAYWNLLGYVLLAAAFCANSLSAFRPWM